tara:strand:- start:1425 stop:1658 length:234 start_codon:yes stop_codon:yes gene_type:complete
MIARIRQLWKDFMLWLEIVKILVKHAKNINAELKKEKSANDDSPGVITPEEYAVVITDNLLEAVPELVAVYQKRKRR